MGEVKLPALPELRYGRVLILRTARSPQVTWVFEQLRARFPHARFGLLGTNLASGGPFEGVEKFEVRGDWLTPDGVRPFKRTFAENPFDIAVMVLNGDGAVGYEHVSQVMKSIPASTKLVAGYDRTWELWNTSQFVPPSLLRRTLATCLECALLPLVAIYMLGKSSSPRYLPAEQSRRAPGYER